MEKEEYDDKSLAVMETISLKLDKNSLQEERLNNFEKMVESRLLEVEVSVKKYERFISETTGFFTRIGFYLDGIVLYFKVKFGKK